MTTSQSQPSSSDYTESVRVPGWMIGVLGLVLGVTAGVMSGVAIRNVVGDDPIIEGSSAMIFYVSFALAVLVDVFVLFNFTNLALKTSSEGFEFRYGMFGKSFRWSQIESVESKDYRWITYGGWGIRLSTQGRRAWSQMGVKGGVLIKVGENGKDRSYFVSSRRPDELEAAIQRNLLIVQPEPDALTDQSDSTES